MMTVRDLKKILEKYDDNARVVINDSEWGWGDISDYSSADDKDNEVVILESED